MARRAIRFLCEHACGRNPDGWAACKLVPALRRHAPSKPPITVFDSERQALELLTAVDDVDALPEQLRIGVYDHATRSIYPAWAARAASRRSAPAWLRHAPPPEPYEPTAIVRAAEDVLSPAEKLTRRAMQPGAVDELSRAIAATAARLVKIGPAAKRGGLIRRVRCWRWATLLTLRRRASHGPRSLAELIAEPPAGCAPEPPDRRSVHPWGPGWRKPPSIAELKAAQAEGRPPRDRPLSPAEVRALLRLYGAARPPSTAAMRIAERITAWERAQPALDSRSVRGLLNDDRPPIAQPDLVKCCPHTGPPALPADGRELAGAVCTAPGGQPMSP